MAQYKTTFAFVLLMLVAFIAGWFGMLALLSSRW
jgi:hypothetical protein